MMCIILGVAIQRCAADTQRLTNVCNGESRVITQHHCLFQLLLVHGRLTPALLAPCPRRLQSGLGVLDHVVALELGEGGDDVEEQLAGGGAGVDALVEAFELDAFVLHRLDRLNQLLHGPTEPGELPDDERIAAAHEGERFCQPRAGGLGTAGLVLKDALAIGDRQKSAKSSERPD